MAICLTYDQFKKVMYKKGYIINDASNRKYPTIRSINDKKVTRMYQLGEQYLPKNIADKVYKNPYYVQEKYYKLMKPKKNYKQYNVYKVKGNFKNMKKLSGIDVLFLVLFHLLGINTRPNVKKHQPLSPEMKRAVRQMERYSKEIRLIVIEKIKTVEDVEKCIIRTEKEIKEVTNIRQKYRNKLRNCKDDKLIMEYKLKISNCTTILNRYRKNVKTVNYILEDIPKVKKVISIERQMTKEKEDVTKVKKKDRYLGR